MNDAVPKEDDDEDEENGDARHDADIKNYIKGCWKKEFKPFFNPQDYSPAMNEHDTMRSEKRIREELLLGIANVRSEKKLEMHIKPLVLIIIFLF